MKKYKDMDEYISNFSKNVQAVLKKFRQEIHKTAPKATEAISYGIPTFKLNGNLVHFAGWEHHLGFYPGPEAIEVFQKELSKYKLSRGTVQFPPDKPIPYGLIKKIVKFKVKKNTPKGGK